MNKKFQSKEFAKMPNEELCAIALRLKSQLVEARFKMASGEIEKISVVKQIRKTIAKVFTELTNRGYKVSIGAHGVTMYEIATGKAHSLDPKTLDKFNTKDTKEEKKAPKAEEKAKEVKKEAAKEVKKPAAKEIKKGESK